MSFSIRSVQLHAHPQAISPTLQFYVNIRGENGPDCRVLHASGVWSIEHNNEELIVCPVEAKFNGAPSLNSTELNMIFHGYLTREALNKIEDIRKGEKLRYKLHLELSCIELASEGRVRQVLVPTSTHQGVIEKSFWSEDILGKVGYADISVVPLRFTDIVRDVRIEDEIKCFEKALDHYNRGDNDHTLTECRKAMNGIHAKRKDLGLLDKLPEDEKGAYERAFKPGKEHLSLGAHGESEHKSKVLRRDAELGLLTTFAFLRYVSQLLATIRSE